MCWEAFLQSKVKIVRIRSVSAAFSPGQELSDKVSLVIKQRLILQRRGDTHRTLNLSFMQGKAGSSPVISPKNPQQRYFAASQQDSWVLLDVPVPKPG